MSTESGHITSTFKDALIYGLAGVLGKAAGFIMLPVYAHYLRGEGYGIISMIDVVLSALGVLIGYGISGAMRRFYFQKDSDDLKNIFISTNITLMIILVTCITLPALIFAEPIALLAFGKAGLGHYLVLGMITFIFSTSGVNAENYILIRQKSLLFSILSLAKLIIGLSLNIYYVVMLEKGVLGFLYSNLITGMLFAVITHAYVYYLVGFHFNALDAKEILRFSLPLVPGYTAMFFRVNTDRMVLRTYLGLTQLGAYEMILKFVTLLVVFITDPLSKSWDVKRMEVCDTQEGPVYMSRMFTYTMALSFFLGLILALEIPLVLRVLTPEEFWLGGGIVVLAIISRLFMDSYYHFFFGLLYAKLTYKVSIIQFSTAMLSVFLNLMLIRHYGILGAVFASSAVNGAQAVLGYFMARRYYLIPFEWGKLGTMFGLFLSLYLVINQITLEGTVLGTLLTGYAAEPLRSVFHVLHLDSFRDGKLVNHVIHNIPLMFEGMIKLISAFSFFVILPFIGILPREIHFRTKAAIIPR